MSDSQNPARWGVWLFSQTFPPPPTQMGLGFPGRSLKVLLPSTLQGCQQWGWVLSR